MGSTRARIAIDAMGGDHAPGEIVAGALRAREELGVEVFLVGDPQQIEAALQHHSSSSASIEIIPAEGTIEMCEEPLSALRRKPQASVNVAMDLVKKGKAMVWSQQATLGRQWRQPSCGLVACGVSIALRSGPYFPRWFPDDP